jgi:hypothetical protein
MSYHARMMNIRKGQFGNRPHYQEGHRDARHAAAEIALEADAEIERLRAVLGELHRRLGMNSDWFQRCIRAALDGDQAFARSTADEATVSL